METLKLFWDLHYDEMNEKRGCDGRGKRWEIIYFTITNYKLLFHFFPPPPLIHTHTTMTNVAGTFMFSSSHKSIFFDNSMKFCLMS